MAAFERPTFVQIRDRILADIDAELEGGTYSRGLFEYALACALAGVALLLYAYLERVAKNSVPDNPESAMMLRWAAFFGFTQKVPSPNKGAATFEAAPGSIIPGGTTLRLEDGTEFTVDGPDTEDGGSCFVFFTAVVPGTAGRATAGAKIVLGSPVAGVISEGVVFTGGITGGTDQESIRSMFARFLKRLRQAPRGGGIGDYVAWALEVPGVTRAWEYSSYELDTLLPGSVRVLFMTDDEPDPIPSPAKVAEVQAYIDSKRPVTVPDFLAMAPTPLVVPVTGTLTVETGYVLSAVRSAATANIKDFMRREAVPGQLFPLSRLDEVVSTTAGERSHNLTAPLADVQPGPFEIVIADTPAATWS